MVMSFIKVSFIVSLSMVLFVKLNVMYNLVRYVEDGVYYVCHNKCLKKKDGETLSKWLDRKWYPAKVMVEKKKKRDLENLAFTINNNLPKIIVKKECFSIVENNKEADTTYFYSDDGMFSSSGSIYIPDSDSSESSENDINYEDDDTLLKIISEKPAVCRQLIDESEDDQYSSEKPAVCRQLIDESEDDQYSSEKPACRQLIELNEQEGNMDLCMICGLQIADLLVHMNTSHKNEEVAFHLYSDEKINQPKRKYPVKKHFCIYCKNLQSKLSRHLERKHNSEEDVQKAITLPKKSSARSKALLEIQKKGDFYYNTSHTSTPICVRKPHQRENSGDHYIPCPHCKGFYSKLNLRNHIRLNCKGNSSKNARNVLSGSKAVLPKIHHSANEILKTEIFPKLLDDEVVKSVAYDELTIAYGNMLAIKYNSSKHFQKMIRQRIRHVGRILLKMRALAPEVITNVASIFDPAHIDIFVQAVHELAGLKNGKYDTPSLATSSCTIISQLGKTLIYESIKKGDDAQEATAKKFLFLLEHSMNALINKTAIENRTGKQREKVVVLPEVEHVKQLFLFLNNEILRCIEQLNVAFDLAAWTTLSKAVLVNIMIFNRKRPGDIERARILEYNNLQVVTEQIAENLKETDKQYARAFARFICRGKLDKPAPVLISNNMKQGLDIILKFRQKADVLEQNPYLFATPHKSTHDEYFSASIALRQFRISLCLPDNITATNLRKHVATVTYNLSHGEKLVLSDFLGHAFNIHENIYRQVPVVRDVVEVGNMLTGALGLNQDQVQSDFISNELENTSNQENQSMEDATLSISQVEGVFHDLSTVNEENEGGSVENIINTPESNINTPIKKKQRNRVFPTNFSSVQRRTWMTPERHAARNAFQWYIDNKKVPSIKTTQRLSHGNGDLQGRTVSQIQTWIIAEIQRNSKTGSRGARTWRTPEKSACRLHFAPYYKTKTYPSQSELQEAISVVPELRNVSPNRLKSHLQHDFKYLTLKQTLESEYYSN